MNGVSDRPFILHFCLLFYNADVRNLDYIASNVRRVMKIEFKVM